MEEAKDLPCQTAMQESKTQEKADVRRRSSSFVKEENKRESKEIDELVSYTYGQERHSERVF